MVIAILTVLGLAAGSFINALVWRTHESARSHKKIAANLSVVSGRSICPSCQHVLAAKDLVPVFSWLALKGKCRYCHQPISIQYPLVELLTAATFVLSYLLWPAHLGGRQTLIFGLWLIAVVWLIALLIYDLRWRLLPNRFIYPLSVVIGLQVITQLTLAGDVSKTIVNYLLAIVIGGGLFYVLFQVSGGKWIGGGDVKLGLVLGLIAGTPAKSFLLIFIASLLGTVVSLPLLINRQLKRTSTIAFGPFLILAVALVVLFGQDILNWYQNITLGYPN